MLALPRSCEKESPQSLTSRCFGYYCCSQEFRVVTRGHSALASERSTQQIAVHWIQVGPLFPAVTGPPLQACGLVISSFYTYGRKGHIV